ncbi:amidohydrolase family protein [Pseudomonas sp. TE3610]
MIYTGPLFDSHLHLYDPSRPEGIPWPQPGDAIFGPRLPADYWALAAPAGVVGALVVEASPRRLDNDWVLRTLDQDSRLVGYIGNLDPLASTFHQDLDHLSADRRFRGIRYGNLWDRDLLADQQQPGFIDGLAQVAERGLVLDSANPDARLIKALLMLSDRLPELRIVIDHLPNAADLAFTADLQELASRPQVVAKLAEIPQTDSQGLILDPSGYRDVLARLFELFGEDRCFFGSDWPNSDHITDFNTTVGLVKACLATQPAPVQEKFFLRNAPRVYGLLGYTA